MRSILLIFCLLNNGSEPLWVMLTVSIRALVVNDTLHTQLQAIIIRTCDAILRH
jgi:hypothetical protein